MEEMMVAAMACLPIGYRFHPTDEEIIGHYLWRKNLGQDEPVCLIPEVELNRWEPEELPGKFIESSIIQSKDPEWWFFCEQEPGRMQHRSTRRGRWNKTGNTREIKSRYGTKHVIGSKKVFSFIPGNNSKSTKTDWVMHEYHLAEDALKGLVGDDRKNYIVCMIRCNSDEMPNSAPSYEGEQDEPMILDITNILEQESDYGFIPEQLVQARMRSLETLCRNETVNPNPPPPSGQFLDHSNNSADSSRTQFSIGRDSIELDPPFSSSEDSDSGYILQAAFGELDDNFSGTPTHQQQAVIMQNKQTPKVESLHGFLPLDEKKGIVEDESAQPTYSSLRTETPKSRSKKEFPKINTYVSSEANARTHAPSKIKEEIISEGSSSISICKPRELATTIRLGGGASAATTIKKKEIIRMGALSDREKPPQEQKLKTADAKPISCSSSHSSRKCSGGDPSLLYIRNLAVGIILCLAIFREIFGL